jgi:tetratricopeptide (TPR) repeat protein
MLQLNVLAAAAARESGRSEEAKRRLDVAESLAPKVEIDEIQIGLSVERLHDRYESGDFFSAIAIARHAEEKFRDLLERSEYANIQRDIRIHSAIASACMGHFRAAIQVLEAEARESKNDSTLWFYLGHCQTNLRQFQNALESLTKAAKLGVSGNLEQTLHYEVAVLHTAQRKLSDARMHLERAKSLGPLNEKLAEYMNDLDRKLSQLNQ